MEIRKSFVESWFESLEEEANFSSPDNSLDMATEKVTIKGNDYSFVTKFLTQEESEALYNTDLLKTSGIYVYKYEPRQDDPKQFPRYYVGKAMELRKRLRAHWQIAEHDSVALHAAMQKWGIKNFKVAIIGLYNRINLSEGEKYWISELQTFTNDYDYNLTPGGDGGATVYKLTPELIQEIERLLRETDLTPAVIANKLEDKEAGFKIGESVIQKIANGTYETATYTSSGEIRDKAARDKIAAQASEAGWRNQGNAQKVSLYKNDTFIGEYETIGQVTNYIYNEIKDTLPNMSKEEIKKFKHSIDNNLRKPAGQYKEYNIIRL